MQDDVLDATANETAPVKTTLDMADLSLDGWLKRIEDLGEDRGYFEPLGSRHSAILTDEGATLIVTFETARTIREGSDSQEPMGWELVEDNGWSNLCLIAHEDSWFRDPAVYGYFDRLVDDGFFEDFDHVVFYGADMCAYAAAAFSVVAPGATVIAVQPQATLDPTVAGWDRRFPTMRRVSFTDRYGYAPDMLEGAGQVFVIHDPEETLDAMHASLFTRANVTHLTCPRLGEDLEAKLWRMEVLPDLLDAAGRDVLTAIDFHRAYRQGRRGNMPYLRTLLDRLQKQGRHRMVQMLCNSVLRRMNAPRFRRARDSATEALEKSREVEPLTL